MASSCPTRATEQEGEKRQGTDPTASNTLEQEKQELLQKELLHKELLQKELEQKEPGDIGEVALVLQEEQSGKEGELSNLQREGREVSSEATGHEQRRYPELVDNLVCGECGTSFTEAYSLLQHQICPGRCERIKKRKSGDLSCPRCFQNFSHKSSWQSHIDYNTDCVAKKLRKEQRTDHNSNVPGPGLLTTQLLPETPVLEETTVESGCQLEVSQATGVSETSPDTVSVGEQEVGEQEVGEQDVGEHKLGEQEVGEQEVVEVEKTVPVAVSALVRLQLHLFIS